MKFTGRRVKGIIRIPSDFTEIDGIDRYGRIMYDVDYWASIPNSIRNRTVTVRISVYNKNPIVKTDMFDGVKTPEQAVQALSYYEGKRKNKVRSARARPVAVKYSDISAYISNSVARKIYRDPKNAWRYLRTEKRYVVVKSSKHLDGRSKKTANYSYSTVKRGYRSKNVSHRRAALKSIFAHGVCPSAAGEASFPINTIAASMQGVRRRGASSRHYSFAKRKRKSRAWTNLRNSKSRQSRSNYTFKKSRWGGILRNKLRSRAYRNRSDASSLPIKTHVVMRRRKIAWVHIKEEIRISQRRIRGASKLYFLIELLDHRRNVVDVINRIVDHDAEMEDFLTPDYAPKISAWARRPGKNYIIVRQIDRVAREVWIYRKVLNLRSPRISNRYKLIKKVKLSRRDRYMRIVDRAPNSNLCVYRAVAVGPRRKVSSQFRNTICRPYRRHTNFSKRSDDELVHVSIFAQTVDDKVLVRVTNVPEGPCALYVTAEDLSVKPQARSHGDTTRIVGTEATEQIQPINETTTEVSFEDTQVQHGHIYEYRCVMIYPSGKEQQSMITEVHEFHKEIGVESKIVVDLNDMNLYFDDDGNSAVTFEIEPTFTDTGMETIVNALESAGTNQNFLSEVKSDRSKLNDLLAFLVQRQDSVSGETESMGIFNAGLFADDISVRRARGVSPLSAGRTYRYIVRVLMRSAEGLFDTAISDEVDLETARRFKVKISKFMNPTTLRTGTLPSTGQAFGKNPRSRMKLQDKFLEGRTGIEAAIDVDIPAQRATIDNVVAERINPQRVKVNWTVSGDQNDIDHFIVRADFYGVTSTVGSVHNFSSSGRYWFYDHELYNEPGTVEYSVIPVYSDYTYGTEVDAEAVTLEEPEPSFTVGT